MRASSRYSGAQRRRRHGEGQGLRIHDRDDYPPAEESIDLLRRSGWSTSETAWHAISVGIVYQVDGSNGESQIRVAGATPREAWHCAVEAAAACGMRADWPRPTGGAG